MNKSYLLTILKAKNPQWHSLFRVLFIFTLSSFFTSVHAQCPVIKVTNQSKTICSGTASSISLSSNQPGTTYIWTTVQLGIVGAADGEGSVISNVLSTLENIGGSVFYTITPVANGCKGSPEVVKVFVNPIPVAMASVLASTITSGNAPSIKLTGSSEKTVFSWTVVQSGVTGAKAASGPVIDQILTTYAEKGIATYRITPNFDGCAGEPINAKVIVKKSL